MDSDATRPISNQAVLYHCTCGEQLVLDANVGGQCKHCHRTVSPKLLDQDLCMTVTLNDNDADLEKTQSAGFDLDIQTLPAKQKLTPLVAEELIGQMFGHFKLVAPLGFGGMGQVYRAFDTSLQRYVAVKLLRSGMGDHEHPRGSDEEVEKLLQEAVSQARVTHPSIVTIYYVGKQDGNPFLAMELVNGKPLSERVKSRMDFDEVVQIAMDITSALEYSFELDIIHGDIKPSNVLITRSGMAKLSDFGMARSASRDTEKSVGGTPSYLAPELLHGKRPSVQSDIYALGVTFFEMTFGRLPRTMTGKSVAQWIKNHDELELDFPTLWPEQLPETWKTVLTKMLACDPAERHQTFDELLNELNSIKPASKTDARFFPRMFAVGIDWAIALSLTVLFQIGMEMPAWKELHANFPIFPLAFHLVNFLPIVCFTILTYFWRQSIGRTLMHIRVVNQFGMRPTASTMAMRSLVRMQFPWVVIALELFRNELDVFPMVVLASIYMLSLMFLVVDLAFMVVFSKNRAIHDIIWKTRVVLDTTNAE